MIFACYYQCRSSWILKRFNRYWVKIQNRNKLVTICYSIVVTIVHHIWPSLVLRFDRIIHWTFSISLWYYLSSVEVSGHVEGSERSCGRKWAIMWEEVTGVCIDFPSFYDFDILFWNCSDSVVFFIFHFIPTL